jgi:hypothetical protein
MSEPFIMYPYRKKYHELAIASRLLLENHVLNEYTNDWNKLLPIWRTRITFRANKKGSAKTDHNAINVLVYLMQCYTPHQYIDPTTREAIEDEYMVHFPEAYKHLNYQSLPVIFNLTQRELSAAVWRLARLGLIRVYRRSAVTEYDIIDVNTQKPVTITGYNGSRIFIAPDIYNVARISQINQGEAEFFLIHSNATPEEVQTPPRYHMKSNPAKPTCNCKPQRNITWQEHDANFPCVVPQETNHPVATLPNPVKTLTPPPGAKLVKVTPEGSYYEITELDFDWLNGGDGDEIVTTKFYPNYNHGADSVSVQLPLNDAISRKTARAARKQKKANSESQIFNGLAERIVDRLAQELNQHKNGIILENTQNADMPKSVKTGKRASVVKASENALERPEYDYIWENGRLVSAVPKDAHKASQSLVSDSKTNSFDVKNNIENNEKTVSYTETNNISEAKTDAEQSVTGITSHTRNIFFGSSKSTGTGCKLFPIYRESRINKSNVINMKLALGLLFSLRSNKRPRALANFAKQNLVTKVWRNSDTGPWKEFGADSPRSLLSEPGTFAINAQWVSKDTALLSKYYRTVDTSARSKDGDLAKPMTKGAKPREFLVVTNQEKATNQFRIAFSTHTNNQEQTQHTNAHTHTRTPTNQPTPPNPSLTATASDVDAVAPALAPVPVPVPAVSVAQLATRIDEMSLNLRDALNLSESKKVALATVESGRHLDVKEAFAKLSRGMIAEGDEKLCLDSVWIMHWNRKFHSYLSNELGFRLSFQSLVDAVTAHKQRVTEQAMSDYEVRKEAEDRSRALAELASLPPIQYAKPHECDDGYDFDLEPEARKRGPYQSRTKRNKNFGKPTGKKRYWRDNEKAHGGPVRHWKLSNPKKEV